jgi:hypothetical protein
MRAETDSTMSVAWVIVYLLPIIAAFVWVSVIIVSVISNLGAFITNSTATGQPVSTAQVPLDLASVVDLFLLVMVISLVAYLVLIYLLVKRRNAHFKRQIFLFEDLINTAKVVAARKNIDTGVKLASLDRTVREVKSEEIIKDAVLWAILSALTGIIVWYVWYFLMKDFYKHETREDGFWDDFIRTLENLGIKFSVPQRKRPMPDRSFALYLVLTIITLGFFGIYWLYVLLTDPNEHFGYHVQIENAMLSSLETSTI